MALKCLFPGCAAPATEHALILDARGAFSEIHSCAPHSEEFPMQYTVSDGRQTNARPAEEPYEECFLHAVLFSEAVPERFRLVLKSKETGSVLVFDTGYFEGGMIDRYVRTKTHRSRLTHDLLLDIVNALGGVPTSLFVSGYDATSGVYRCVMEISVENEVVSLPCRLSDAVALSLRAPLPLFLNSTYLKQEATPRDRVQ